MDASSPHPASAGSPTRFARRAPSPWALVTAGVVLAYLGLGLWWSIANSGLPSADSAAHIDISLTYRDAITHGNPWLWFSSFDIYAPLVHLVGIVVAAVAGVHIGAFVFGGDLLFVPLLALGCYGTATLVYGRAAGALAAVFALGAPMIVSASHSFLLDAPLTAMTAMTVWLVLLSRRFASTKIALAAGLFAGLGMMTKSTFPAGVAGLILVILIRGGWRQWRGWLAFGIGMAVVAAPWYLRHALDQAVFANGVSVQGLANLDDPATGSVRDLTYYLWDAVVLQLYTPLALVAAIGIVVASVGWLRGRDRDGPVPELIGGLVLGWLLIDLSKHNDPRYTLPLLVYLAVLGTGWIVALRPRWLAWTAALAVSAVAAINVVFISTGAGGTASVTLPGAPARSDVGAGHLTFFSNAGYVDNEPLSDGGLLAALRSARAAGIRGVKIESASADALSPAFTGAGVTLFVARLAGLRVLGDGRVGGLGPDDMLVFRRPYDGTGPRPCAVLADGSGVFFERAQAIDSAEPTWCPNHRPAYQRGRVYERPLVVEPPTAPRKRAEFVDVLRAARRDGVRAVSFHMGLASNPALRGAEGVARIAAQAGMAVVPANPVTGLRTGQALAFSRPVRPDYPRPCLRLPDGSGVYLVRGGLRVPLQDVARRLLVCSSARS